MHDQQSIPLEVKKFIEITQELMNRLSVLEQEAKEHRQSILNAVTPRKGVEL